jgi:hypothetical protein
VSTPKRRLNLKCQCGAGNNRDRGRDCGANEASVERGAETGVDLKVSSGQWQDCRAPLTGPTSGGGNSARSLPKQSVLRRILWSQS